MCGIAGIIGTDGSVTKDRIRHMTDAIAHRGPDDAGVYVNANNSVGLGHRRLSIIDLSADGHEPMCNEDETIWLTFNGEIYNFKELREELIAKGHSFRSQTDAEVIIHLYEEEGDACIEQLRGMFAFAIWDEKNKRCLLARDRTGQKPLKYYLDEDGTLMFASELKAILADPTVPREADREAIHMFLALNHVPAPRTGFLGIEKLPAGHFAVFENGMMTIERYWELDFQKKTLLSYHDAQTELLKLLRESVNLRMIADVPLGAFLSGGIDSSLVVALMSEERTNPVKTFSIGFPESGYDETSKAKQIADKFETDHTEFIVEPNAELLPKLVHLYEEPYADSSALPSYLLAELTRKHVTVALNGDGGDEALGGYKRYLYWQYMRWMSKRAYEKIETHFYFDQKKWKYASSTPRCVTLSGTKPKAKCRRSAASATPLSMTRSNLHNLNDVFALSFESFLPDDLLVKVDIATMAHALESRSPFLDHIFLEFCASLPAKWKVGKFQTKKILRDACKGILPMDIINQKKQGFNLPVDEWFAGPLHNWAREIILNPSFINRGYFDEQTLTRLLDEHRDHKKKHGQRIWTLICLELWHREYIDA